MRAGWDDIGNVPTARRLRGLLGPKKLRGGGWLGKQDSWRKNLPIGGKSILTAAGAGMGYGAIKKKDDLGQGRSRTERVMNVAGDLGGSLLGAGAMLALPGSKFRALRSIGGAIGGSMLGSAAVSTPWRMARARENTPVLSRKERQQLMSQGALSR